MDNLKITLDDMKLIVNNLPEFEKCHNLLCSIFIPNKVRLTDPMLLYSNYEIKNDEFQQLTFMKDYNLKTWILIENNIIKTIKT
jgi:hypothetical protein